MSNRTKSILIGLVSFVLFANIAIMIILFLNVKKGSEAESSIPVESAEREKDIEEVSNQEEEPEEPVKKEVNRKVNKEAVANTERAMNIEGSWDVSGKSIWEFYSGTLTISGGITYNYSVASNADKNGYTVVTVNGAEGKYALLLKKTNYGMEGFTVKGADYQAYLKHGQAQVKDRLLEFYGTAESKYSREPNSLQSKDAKYMNVSNEVIYYRVITGAYSDRANAEREMNELINAGYEAVIIDPYQAHSVAGSEGLYSVMCGSYEKPADAEMKAAELLSRGFDAIVVEYRS